MSIYTSDDLYIVCDNDNFWCAIVSTRAQVRAYLAGLQAGLIDVSKYSVRLNHVSKPATEYMI